ncbi:MAG: 50S ribosomal protein L10 [Clostridiales Family XIII bacterium]|nr:50S ribosomal protein L10 [Clostridiales Family XIII bacterium]
MSETNLKKKQLVIDEIKEKFEKASSAVIIDYIGTTVVEADAMRKKLREADVDYKVYKNSLVERAIIGTPFEDLKDALAGPSAFAFSYDDPAAPARVINGVIKEYKKMAFKAGVVEGTIYDADGIKAIADLPSRDELIAKFLGSIQSPVASFARLVSEVAKAKEDGTFAPVEAAPAEEAATEEAPAAPAEAPVEEAPVAEEAPVVEEETAEPAAE